jgi:hypothetical protein
MQPNLTTLLLKIPRNNEYTPEAAQTFLSTLTQINGISGIDRLLGKKALSLSLEICLYNQQILFQITCDNSLVQFVETQIQSSYPLVIIEKISDPIFNQTLEVESLTLRKGSNYAIQTFSAFTDIDPMASILSVFAKASPDQISIIQFALESTDGSWQSSGARFAERGTKNEDGSYSPRSDASVIKEKIAFPGFRTSLRIASNTKETLRDLYSAFGVFTKSDGNSLTKKKHGPFSKGIKEVAALHQRQATDSQVLNIVELATLWHLPNNKIKTSTIVWGIKVLSEPPDNLPVANETNDEERQDLNFFAKTTYKNKDAVFGLKTIDRMRHIWIVGKTGTGKSTLIANMAVDDVKKGRGVAIIDPHGDLCDTLLDFIPDSRINDVIYFNPADRETPMVINPLQVTNREEAELVVSGIVSIFNKIFGFSWGPRLEYILRNTLLTLSAIPDTTLEDVLTMLTNPKFRKRVVDQLTDPVLKNFWVNEFEKMPDKLREESISPILNKVGQFVTSPLIRRVIGQPKSSFAIDDVMNSGQILLANLSQGRLGEDNATLLGAMLITKFQLAAMRRVQMAEQERKNFFLYVDEFQNFATPSFMKILSEARKYRLGLTLANQYMAQIPEEVQKSILGNAGTMVTFTAGAEDAAVIFKEFSEVFSEADLVNLARHQIAIKLMVDGQVSRPFIAHTLPLPASRNQNKERVIQTSKQRFGNKENPIPVPTSEPVAIHPRNLPPEPTPPPQQAQPRYHDQNNNQNRYRDNNRRAPAYHGPQSHQQGGGRPQQHHQNTNRPQPHPQSQPQPKTVFEAPKEEDKPPEQ